jgi:hypothetical protein
LVPHEAAAEVVQLVAQHTLVPGLVSSCTHAPLVHSLFDAHAVPLATVLHTPPMHSLVVQSIAPPQFLPALHKLFDASHCAPPQS